MTPFVYSFVKKAKEVIGTQNRVLEIGSLDVNGTIRDNFSDATEYIGIDLLEGPGVDRVIDAHDLKLHFEKDSFDLVICCETFEHDKAFWETYQNILYVLKPNGWLILTAPAVGCPYHNNPDYWRFNPESFEEIFFKDFNNVKGIVAFVEGTEIPMEICGFGQKPS